MALPDYGRIQSATEKTVKNSGGDGTISVASVANNAARQSTKVDFGATRASLYAVVTEFELAATPTAGNAIEIYGNPSTSATAGTDNLANCDGTDSAYSGYSSNLADSVKQLEFVGAHICTAQATATVQKGFTGFFTPKRRYYSFVVYNKSGAAFHSTNTNQVVKFVPVEDVIEET